MGQKMFVPAPFWNKNITTRYRSSETETAGIPTLGINFLLSP